MATCIYCTGPVDAFHALVAGGYAHPTCLYRAERSGSLPGGVPIVDLKGASLEEAHKRINAALADKSDEAGVLRGIAEVATATCTAWQVMATKLARAVVAEDGHWEHPADCAMVVDSVECDCGIAERVSLINEARPIARGLLGQTFGVAPPAFVPMSVGYEPRTSPPTQVVSGSARPVGGDAVPLEEAIDFCSEIRRLRAEKETAVLSAGHLAATVVALSAECAELRAEVARLGRVIDRSDDDA